MPKMENCVKLSFEEEAKEQMKALSDAADRICKSVDTLELALQEQKSVGVGREAFIKDFWRLMPRNEYEGVHCARLRNSTDVGDILRVIEEYIEKNPNDEERDSEDE